jgi:hypothetical protein
LLELDAGVIDTLQPKEANEPPLDLVTVSAVEN